MNMSESFRWFRDDMKPMDKHGQKIIIKGKAIYPTVSRNNRRYLDDELLRSARTLTGQPIDINHEMDVWEEEKEAHEKLYGIKYSKEKPKYKGHVIAAEYEDGAIEYVAEINDKTYVEKLIDGSTMTPTQYKEKWGKDPIYGVSISANFWYPEEGAEKLTPIGIQFKRLSLVEDPEKPGVRGTTIQLMEKLNERSLEEVKIVGRMLETVSRPVYESYKTEVIDYLEGIKMDEHKYVVAPDLIAVDPRNIHAFDAPASEEPEKEEEESPVVEAEKEETEAPVEEDFKPLDESIEDNKLGEPFGGYKDFADCVAKNSDKDDPDAYCAAIQKKVEDKPKKKSEENLELKSAAEALAGDEDDGLEDEKRRLEEQHRVKQTDKKISGVTEAVKILDGNIAKIREQLSKDRAANSEARECFGGKVSEQVKELKALKESLEEKAGVDKVKQLKESLDKQSLELNAIKEDGKQQTGNLLTLIDSITLLNETMKAIDKRLDDVEKRQQDENKALKETVKTLRETDNVTPIKEELLAKITSLNEELKTLKETDKTKALEADLEAEKAKMAKLEEKVENILTHVKPSFKSQEKPVEPEPTKVEETAHLHDPKEDRILV